ncbi:phage gp6-like head-tail connector protein [Salmonella enterica subsp. enterica serovar Senftenberg]|uniref:Phage gp6-like head-tail connector protein n=1 Tax=Salmonella senftenberg TaxID=28150 RepID=A0A3V3R5G9_SALSE|nr:MULTISPECIES: head-tail connector protein [Salmonella]EAW1158115.1 phage gp6-like head-tail connector protein [Salmonella enterica subsp. enterica]EBF1860940.1 phage gp6-like head-tail connector protein [Salmonella enterica subsp. enterica serovar Heidelberg]ECH8095748.1 phage gp6-like head-tail connector protein [Salmonella enterica subsp. enterica serovar Miami]EDB5584997.1 phage gp6-like head-tail connector protein [Salmonella enterica subsp. enterica serovar Schwarzengrund]EDB5629703.1 
MAELITLEEVKLHCRIDGDDENALINGYIVAALEICQKHIGRRFDDGLEFNPALKVGCLLLVGHWYEHREIVAEKTSELPFSTSSLWNYYREPGVY